MKRLTKKFNKYGRKYCFNCKENISFSNDGDNIVYKSLNKLGQLEDFEEELGVDLNIKLKVETYYMKYYKLGSVYVYTKEGRKLCIYHFYPTGIKVLLGGEEFSIGELLYKDYGKTWALTKEELI